MSIEVSIIFISEIQRYVSPITIRVTLDIYFFQILLLEISSQDLPVPTS